MSKFKPLTGYLPILIFCILGVLIYSNTFHASFHFDDSRSIVKNINIITLSNLKAIWNFWPTRFVTYLSVALNYHFNRLDVFGYHLVNLIIHLCTTVLVWWFVCLITNNKAKLLALFSGLIFLSHPIQTQSVTYIIQRATSLAALFYLASLVLYIKSRQVQQLNAQRFYYFAALITAAMAMFTKENTITLPFMLLLCEFCFLKSKNDAEWKKLTPFFLMLLFIPLTMFLTNSVNFMQMHLTSEPSPGISPIHYFLTQFRVMVTYLRLLLIPLNQNVDYDYPVVKTLLSSPVIVSIVLLVAILITAIRIFPRHRLISFSIFWVFLTLLPESSLIPINDVIFEHRLYLPMVGYSIFLASIIYSLFLNRDPKLMAAAMLIIIACYSILTYTRNFVWKDELTLWNDVVQKSPKKARPYNIRGVTYNEQGNFDRAIVDYNKAIEIFPKYAFAYSNRGLAYKNKGALDQALSDYNKAIQINPKLTESYSNRGDIYQKVGRLDEAISDYGKAIQLNPSYVEVYNNLGNAFLNKGNLNQAIAEFTKAIELNPDYAAGYNNRGCVYKDMGEHDKAISDYNKAIKINPSYAEAYNNMGLAYKNKKDFRNAISNITRAIQLKPDYAGAYNNRSVAYRDKGDFDMAIVDCSRAIEIDPNLAVAYRNRAIAYFCKGQYDKSWEDVHKAEALGDKVPPDFIEMLKKVSNGKI